MGRTLSGRPASGAGKRTADDKSAARWFDWQGPTGSQNGRPRTADVSRGKGGSVRLTVMQAAAAQAAAEAQANAVRNGLPHKGATSPKSGLQPALLSNDQNNYKRRHGLDLQTTKVSRQWSHSGHFPGMTLSCWARGCSKLWGCDHGVGDEELDRQLDLPEWEGRGNDPSVPEWLRYEGKIINRKLSKRFVLGFCHHVWDYKYPPPLIIDIGGVPTAVKREPRHGGLSLAFHECMKTTYGPPKLVAGVAYNMYYGLLRFRKEHADIDIFCRILTDELPSPALFAYMEEIEALRGLLRAADTDSRNKLPRAQVIQVLKQRFGDAFDETRERAARAALDAEQPPLSVHPSWYLNPQNSGKAARINDVEYEKLISDSREADHGPFAQLAKELIIEELRAREWPAARGDITRRPKYGDFLAWRKVRASAAAAGVVGYLNRAVQTPRDTGAREGNDDRGNGLGGVGSTIGRDEGSVNQHLGGTDARETMTELGNTPEGVRSTVGRDESRANQPSVAPDARKTINERGTAPGGVQSTIRGEENRAVAPNLLAPPEQSNVSAGRVFGQNLAPTGEQNVPGVDGNVTSGRDAAPTDSEALGGVNNSRGLRPNPGPPERVVSEDRARSRVSDQAAVQRNEQSGVGGTQSPGLAQAAIPLERVTNAAVATKASARGAQPGAGQTGEEGQPKLGITESSALALAATPQERETSVYNVGAAIEDGSDRGVPPGADQGAESVRPGRGVGLKAVNESGENPKTGVNGGRQETVAGRGTPYEDKGVIGTGISRSAERTDLPRVQLDKADIQTSVSGDIPEQLWEDDQADGINKKGPVLLSVVKPTKEGGPKPVFETISKAAKAIK